eukprot:403367273
MKLISTIVLLLTLSTLTLSKTLKHYCGPKTMDIRMCEKSEDCKYVDEFCNNEQGYCQTDQSLYDNDPCAWNIPQPTPPEDFNYPEVIEKLQEKCWTIRCMSGYKCFLGKCIENFPQVDQNNENGN